MIAEALLTPRYRTDETKLALEDIWYEVSVVNKILEPVEGNIPSSLPDN